MLTDAEVVRPTRRWLLPSLLLLGLLPTVLFLRGGAPTDMDMDNVKAFLREKDIEARSALSEPWMIEDCYVSTACPGACRKGFASVPLPHPCWVKCCPVPEPYPPPLPPSFPPHVPSPPSPPEPPASPPDKVECQELAPFHTTVANTQMAQYLRNYMLPTPPLRGVERMRMGLVESYRYNISVQSLSIGKIRLHGCRYKGRHPVGETILAAEMEHMRTKMSSMASYLPDSIRVEVYDIEFSATMEYYVKELGAPLGSGPVFVRGKGNAWLDDLSIRNADIYAGRGGAGGPVSCGGDWRLTEMNIGGVWHGMEPMYMSDGLNRPDLVGMACDGYESINYNPFSSGWEWLGPGPRFKGMRQQMIDFLQKRCTAPGTPLAQRMIGQCWFMDTWDKAFGAIEEETGLALIQVPADTMEAGEDAMEAGAAMVDDSSNGMPNLDSASDHMPNLDSAGGHMAQLKSAGHMPNLDHLDSGGHMPDLDSAGGMPNLDSTSGMPHLHGPDLKSIHLIDDRL